MARQPKQQSIKTTWSVRTYDVWGNAKDGYEVNDSYARGTVEIELATNKYNENTPQEFVAATPTDAQIKKVFGLGNATQIDTDGDDTLITVNRARDNYPIGELFCESHVSLSPIETKE